MRTIAVCLLTVLAADAAEVTGGSWEQVLALLQGDRVRVQDFGGRRLSGRLVAASGDAVTVSTGSGDSTVARSEVRQVSARRTSARPRNAGIGAAVGAGVGGGLMLALLHGLGGSDAAGSIFAFGAAIGGAVGFALGWIPAGYDTIYKARR